MLDILSLVIRCAAALLVLWLVVAVSSHLLVRFFLRLPATNVPPLNAVVLNKRPLINLWGFKFEDVLFLLDDGSRANLLVSYFDARHFTIGDEGYLMYKFVYFHSFTLYPIATSPLSGSFSDRKNP